MTGVVAHSTPYPWPYDAALAQGRTALLVLGWNDDWLRRCHEPADAVRAIARLAAAVDFVVTVDQPAPVTHGSFGPMADDRSRPEIVHAHAITAAGVDGFFGGPLDTVLRTARRDQLLLVGFGLEAAVHSTMRSANDRGYECLLVVDACAPLDPELVPPAISMVEMSGGIFGAVGTTEPVLVALAASPTGSTDRR